MTDEHSNADPAMPEASAEVTPVPPDQARAANPWARAPEPTVPLPAQSPWPPYQPSSTYQPPAQSELPPYPAGQPYVGSADYPTDYPTQYAAAPSPATAAPYPAGQPYPTAPYSTAQYPAAQYSGSPYGGGNPGASIVGTSEGRTRGRGWLPLLLVALLASLIGGGVGSAITLANDKANETKPTAAGTPGGPTTQAAGQAQPGVREVVPGSVASIAKALLPSVVKINVETPRGGGSGSGVVIRADGFILTNSHVVGDATQIFVAIFAKTVKAKLIGTDPTNDLAVIQAIGAGPLVPAPIGTVLGLRVGDPVIAIGSPLGFAGTVTAGIISALDRRVDVPGEGGGAGERIIGAIQTDAAINPGNSGGALVDGNGKVIGINSAIASLGRSATGGQVGSIGLGFAIPIDLASETANQLIATGKAVHPYIGVNVESIDAEAAAQFNIASGALVDEVTPGGPADKANAACSPKNCNRPSR